MEIMEKDVEVNPRNGLPAAMSLFLLFVLISSAQAGVIYKCTQADGSVTYSSVSCPKDTVERERKGQTGGFSQNAGSYGSSADAENAAYAEKMLRDHDMRKRRIREARSQPLPPSEWRRRTDMRNARVGSGNASTYGMTARESRPKQKQLLDNSGGAINPRTGEFYAPAGNGYVGTRDGTFFAPAGPNGVTNTRTGEFIPVN